MSSNPLKRPAPQNLTYLATFAYDGTAYAGWQLQPNDPTVQQVLEEAFARVVEVPVRLHASGRTDAGVHALAMPADFTLPYELDTQQLAKAWNAVTPPDVSVLSVQRVADGFSARFRGRKRTYRYIILNRKNSSTFLYRWCWHIPDKLDIKAIRAAMSALVGVHDFTTFRASDCEAKNPVREIFAVNVEEFGEGWGLQSPGDWRFAGGPEAGMVVFTITGSAFLKHQVRSIIGTLVEVGRNKMSPARFGEVLVAADRSLAGPTAPARGLTFIGVEFDDAVAVT